MGGQPGKLNRQATRRYGRSRRSLSRYRSRRHQYRFLQWRGLPSRSERIGYLAGRDERLGTGVKPARRSYPWAGAVCSDAPVNFCATSVAAP